MSIWTVYPARRHYPLSIWEPIFITFDQPTKNYIMSDRAVSLFLVYNTTCSASVHWPACGPSAWPESQPPRISVLLAWWVSRSTNNRIYSGNGCVTLRLTGTWVSSIEEVWRKKPRQTFVFVLWGEIAAHMASLRLCSRQVDKRQAGSKMRGIFVYYIFYYT